MVAPRIPQAKAAHKKMKVIAAIRLIMDVLPDADASVTGWNLKGSNITTRLIKSHCHIAS
jgi:hypothetical protein